MLLYWSNISTQHERMSCDNCGEPAQLRCSKCSVVYYCDKECQKTAWSAHKKVCAENFAVKLDGNGRLAPVSEQDVETYYRNQGPKPQIEVKLSRDLIAKMKTAPFSDEVASLLLAQMGPLGFKARTEPLQLEFQVIDGPQCLVIDVRKVDVPNELGATAIARAMHKVIIEHFQYKTTLFIGESTNTFRFKFAEFIVVDRAVFKVITELLNQSMGTTKFQAVEVQSAE
jgi:hypothetical protein